MFDKQTRAAILSRMKTLDSDKIFKEKLEKEISNKKGRELKHYIANAVKLSQNERTDKKQ